MKMKIVSWVFQAHASMLFISAVLIFFVSSIFGLKGLNFLIAVPVLGLAVLNHYTAVGLSKAKRWAWYAGMVLILQDFFGVVFSVLEYGFGNYITLIFLVLSIFLLYVLITEKKTFFQYISGQQVI